MQGHRTLAAKALTMCSGAAAALVLVNRHAVLAMAITWCRFSVGITAPSQPNSARPHGEASSRNRERQLLRLHGSVKKLGTYTRPASVRGSFVSS